MSQHMPPSSHLYHKMHHSTTLKSIEMVKEKKKKDPPPQTHPNKPIHQGQKGFGKRPSFQHFQVPLDNLNPGNFRAFCGPMAKISHCVRTACILRTQRLGYSPKNTCHLFTRGKTERCQYHRVGQVSINTFGCSYNQQHRQRRIVRSWCRLATIEYRRSRAFERR